ncbi:hypothetical protein [Hellea balneolensis]|uniref:hypothetical protein n=1 Tax=Hellea balneolensis TaxID=287478 RepID=UPI0004095AC9|nr:hypothetical protein [Hellea balneolensis]
MRHLFTALTLILISVPAAQAQSLKSLIEQRAAVTRPAPPLLNPYNYTLDIVMSEKEGRDGAEPFSARLRIDPSAVPDSRVAIISTSEEDYPDEFRSFLKETRDLEKSTEDISKEFWCEDDDGALLTNSEQIEDNFTILSETETQAVIKPNLALMAKIMMEGDADEDMSKSERKMMKKMMERLDGEFIISKPDLTLRSMQIWLTRPLTMAVVAKIKEMEITQSCAIAPNGFAYTDTMTMRVKAKALGIGMEQNMDIRISELTLR